MTARPDIAALARRLHEGQFDKAGKPYVGHIERVVANLLNRWPDAGADEIDAAWLHDAIEDCGVTEQSLRALGVSGETCRIVAAVTRPAGSDYLDWIGTLARSGDRAVIRVKLADNEDNRAPERVAAWEDGPQRLATRYEPARRLLEAGLAACEGA
ncbi:hypothetical protein [Ancylobacter sp. TS-1]|uniref:hypothetical protein n=1 Tax=Ancylobacter sp. TS-1 TaxID=1850374 RepID=UPI001391150D|nr:hypothetical protein [Ancylobacter sp. TS-1]